MHIVYSDAFAEVVRSTSAEITALRTLLTRPLDAQNDVCLLSEDGFFLAGLVTYVVREMRKLGVEVTSHGLNPPEPPRPVRGDILDGIELHDWQCLVVMKSIVAQRGIISVPTGGGKTAIYAAILRQLGLPSLTIVGQVNHARQMQEKFASYGIEARVVGGGSSLPDEGWQTHDHYIGVANSLATLARKDHPIFTWAGVLGVDEAHHMGTAGSWQQAASACAARYRFALSATPFEGAIPQENLFDLCLIGLTGDLIVDMPVGFLQERRQLAPCKVYMQPVTSPEVPRPMMKRKRWTVARDKGIVKHETRNNMLLALIERLYREEDDSRQLVLVQMLDHGKFFVDQLSARGVPTAFLSGGDQVYGYSGDAESVVTDFQDGSLRVLVGSVIFDEAVDLPQITDVVMAAGGKKIRRTRQRVGRGLRGTDPVRVWDMLDMHNQTLRSHAEVRRSTYESDGHQVTVGFPMQMAPRQRGAP